jgi:uncharacterized lipoprotein YmbA
MPTRRAAILTLAGLLPGCVSLKRTPQARFFALRPLLDPPATAASPTAIVGLLPAIVPGYLQRPQLVTRAASGELRIDEFLRWAEPLESGLERTLAEDLSALLPEQRVVRSPWPGSLKPACRVRVEISRFGPQADGQVRLEGRFALLPASGELPLLARAVSLGRSLSARSDPGASVEAMSELIAALSREIAEALRGLPTG